MRYGMRQTTNRGKVRHGGGFPCLLVLAVGVSLADMSVHGIVPERVIG